MTCCGTGTDLKAHSYRDKYVENFEKKWNLKLKDTARFEDFDLIRTIGVGAFGRVFCVKNRTNKKFYALKVLKKEKIIRLEQVQRVYNEKRILQSVVNPFLVDLRFVFKTNSYLFFVMPLIRGGEVLSYIKTFRGLSEYQTKFYSGQVILALQYLHSMNIVYRDLKSENVLLECDGYIKIIDYGFSKRLPNGTNFTTSFVGTPEYMAPEMLIRTQRLQGYGCSVDWWTLGIFIFETASGDLPFSGSSLLQLFDAIVKRKYTVPKHFSASLTDLVDNILQIDVNKRIACKGKGVQELKNHAFYADLNWQALHDKKMHPEFVPSCEGDDFTKNFEKFSEVPIEESSKEEFPREFHDF